MIRIVLTAATLAAALCFGAAARADVCDGDAEWKPGRANDEETCRALWDGIGLPGYAAADVDATVVCHSRYVLSHNNVHKTPDYVVERLTRAQVGGDNKRPKVKFTYEENVCKAARAIDRDYAGSGYDRGHQAPSEDFNRKSEWMVESFILSNIIPQVGRGFNQGIWKDLEALVRKLATERGEIYVVTGPVYRDADDRPPQITRDNNACRNAVKFEPPTKAEICDANDKNKKAACDGGVTVPVGLYKIIYDPAAKRANAYILPNIDHRALETDKDPLEYLKRYRTTLRVVERQTGLRFLAALPARSRKQQLDECIPTMLH